MNGGILIFLKIILNNVGLSRSFSEDIMTDFTTFSNDVLMFSLTGVYGDVLRVKILYNKKDSALIQMAESHQAHLGKNIARVLLLSWHPTFFNRDDEIYPLRYVLDRLGHDLNNDFTYLLYKSEIH